MGTRDEMYGKIGSMLGVKCAFSTNPDIEVEGILIVTSYGKRFVEDNDAEKVNELKKLICDVLFPCYQRAMEIEMGAIYFDYVNESKASKDETYSSDTSTT